MSERDILDLASQLKAEGESFALATVVRTISVTAAKAGARALVRSDGVISNGWIGGGCAKAAVAKAAKEAIASGVPKLISIQPEDLLDEQGLSSGDELDGVRFATNFCPSKGTMDIFVEPVLPKPELVIFGSSPVAVALAEMAPRVGYACTVCVPEDQQGAFIGSVNLVNRYAPNSAGSGQRFVVISTQGNGDEAATRDGLSLSSELTSFVGSKAKVASLRQKLISTGVSEESFDSIKAPAGLDLGAITPEEIALSILAEITAFRRQGQRGDAMMQGAASQGRE